MNKKAALLWIIAFIFLVACGGGGDEESASPASDNNTSSSTTTETTETSETEEDDNAANDSEEMAEDPAEEGASTDEAEPMEEETEEETASEEPAEETAEESPSSDSPFGDRPMTGTDPETGLLVNPETINPGDTFIVRGEIISMNLTPTTSPEFLIQSPDGLKFRLRSQALADTYYEDGDQLQAFQYQNGLLAQATATLAADASPSDIPVSTDLVLVKDE